MGLFDFLHPVRTPYKDRKVSFIDGKLHILMDNGEKITLTRKMNFDPPISAKEACEVSLFDDFIKWYKTTEDEVVFDYVVPVMIRRDKIVSFFGEFVTG